MMLGALYCIPLGYRKCAVLISYHAKTERFGCVLASIDGFGSNHLFHKRLQNGIIFNLVILYAFINWNSPVKECFHELSYSKT